MCKRFLFTTAGSTIQLKIPFSSTCNSMVLFNSMVRAELDTGAGVSVIPVDIFKDSIKGVELEPTIIRLGTYNGGLIVPLGAARLSVAYKSCKVDCAVLVVEKGKHMLVGRDLIRLLGIKDINLNSLDSGESGLNVTKIKNELLRDFKELFAGSFGKYNKSTISLRFKPDVEPKFCKPRSIPFAFRQEVEKELEKAEREGIITKVDTSEWGTSLVPVLKENGELRICADYKSTVNQHLEDIQYPFPRIQEIFQALQGGKLFTKLDFSGAYNQLVLDDETSLKLAWSTHKGIFKVNRLPFGTKPACAI